MIVGVRVCVGFGAIGGGIINSCINCKVKFLWVSLDFYGVDASVDGATSSGGGSGGDFMYRLKGKIFMGIFGFYRLQILFKWIS